MQHETYNDEGKLISYEDDRGNIVHLEYKDNRLYKSYTEFDYIIYYYNENGDISYQEVFTNGGKLIRKVWTYYNDNYLDHIISSDGVDIWLDKNGNKTN